jgi:hypothetical protein
MRTRRPALAFLLSLAFWPLPGVAAESGISCVEGFEDIAALTGRGWILRNNSSPLGPGQWTAGDPNLFPAWDGSPGSYVSVDASSAAGAYPVVSNWLITPEIEFGPNEFNIREFGFYTRGLPGNANRLVVRLCLEQGGRTDCAAPGPASGDLGGYQTRLLDINADLAALGYPSDWEGYWSTPADSLPVTGRGRIAFHYYVFAQDGDHGSTIGVDGVSMMGATVCPFTEPVFGNGFE